MSDANRPRLELSSSAEPANAELQALLEFLKRTRGFDFTGYKPNSLTRRIEKRMQAVNVSGFAAYVEYLELNPGEYEQLFNTVLINVTTFFRDPEAWSLLRDDVIPRLLREKSPGAPIRVWSAGCATGEEAFTLAIVLAEALGVEAARDRVKIYATDVDEAALAEARAASYPARDVEDIPPELLEKYFVEKDGRYTFRADLRRTVIFGRHDLIQDAPISRIDLLVCRNALMYFNAETQERILLRFHFALSEGGYLFLGRAETLLTHTAIFGAVDLKQRVFAKVSRGPFRDRLFTVPPRAGGAGAAGTVGTSAGVRLRDGAFDASTVAQIVVDSHGTLMLANERARALFGVHVRDVGRPLQDLELSYRPVELRSCIDSAYADGRAVTVHGVEWSAPGGDAMRLDVRVALVADGVGAPLGVVVSFADITENARLQRELQTTNEELEGAYEELQSTNEELETTNEELQSTVEELETTNEELQSTNEELETMNEELHSTNEELQTINEEVRRRSDEIVELNAFLESVLTSLRGGVMVLDRDLRVTVWSSHAEELWGLRSREVVGQHFLNLDMGLPADQLKPAIRQCLAGEAESLEVTLPATNRRGRTFDCEVVCTPLHGPDGDIRGVILLMR